MNSNQFLSGLMVSVLVGLSPLTDCAASSSENVLVASWYGSRHQGLRTSSGDVFDQEGMTAASSVLPLGSRVRVTSHDTGQSVVVLINDRMGARGARIDLSRGAARQIGLIERGRGVVTVASARDEPVEVAEASEDEVAELGSNSDGLPLRTRGHRHAARMAGQPCCNGARVILTHHAVHRRATRHTL